MEEKTPLVSIIVRTKDRPKLLNKALLSIASQTYKPIEVVLVNDGGCDLSEEELKEILGDVSLNYIRLKENRGRAGAGNVGIENVSGEYIGFLDDDDIYYIPAISSLMDAALLNCNKVVYGKVICKKYIDFDNLDKTGEEIFATPFNAGRLVFENFIPLNSVLVPKYFFYKAGPFDCNFEIYEDWDWLLRLVEIAEFHFMDIIVAEYRIYGTATISGKGGVTFQTFYRQKILEKHIKKAQANDFIAYIQSIIDRIVIEKEEKIQELSSLLKDKDQELSFLHGSEDEEFQRLIQKVADFEESLKLKDEEFQRLRQKVADFEESLKLKDEEIVAHEQKFEGMLSSSSWKITKPLRVIGSIFKKILNRNNE